MNKEKVVVGMSGGVDSSVAAYLLLKAGYEVIGVTMQIWQDEDIETESADAGCCGLSAVDDARRVSNKLGIPYYVMNFKEDFKASVIDYFVEEYQSGSTPNPCIACNRYVKWESLLNRSLNIGADYIATGHYAKVIKLDNGRYTLQESVTAKKDQTYALYNLTQDQLARTLMPVGEYSKEEIREIAKELDLRVHNKPDSQEICFIPDNNYAKFIRDYTNEEPKEGNFVTPDGEILGKHKGIINYTIGQRRGLNLSMGHPVFVLAIRPETNEVVIGNSDEVYSKKLYANNLNFMSIPDLEGAMEVSGKVRYSHKGSTCTIRKIDDDIVECIFDQAQRAITPGQAVVFYHKDIVVGGGTIMRKPAK